MSDIKARIEILQQRAAEHELLGALAMDIRTRDTNRRLAHDLREEAFKLSNELPKPVPSEIPSSVSRHA